MTQPESDHRDAVPELMGAKEAAAALGVKVPNLRRTSGVPEPVQELASGPLWVAAQIRALARERASQPSNRRKP